MRYTIEKERGVIEIGCKCKCQRVRKQCMGEIKMCWLNQLVNAITASGRHAVNAGN